jgi:Uma2 family endonuclease
VHNPPHDNAIELLDAALRPLIPAGWSVRIQSSITTRDSEPEPDLAVVRGWPRDRGARDPTPDEIALVVEVSDSSLDTDRGAKARLYARAGIPVYIIVDLIHRHLEIHREPASSEPEPRYAEQEIAQAGDRIPVVIAGQTVGSIDVECVLP